MLGAYWTRAMTLVLPGGSDSVVVRRFDEEVEDEEEEEREQPRRRYVIPNRRSETFEYQGLADVYQSKYNYALYQLTLQREGKIRFARLCYTRQGAHYYAGQQQKFYCKRRVIEANQKRHKGLVQCEPTLHKAKWRDVAQPGEEDTRLHEPQGFLCSWAFRADGVVQAPSAEWVPMATLKAFYHEHLIVDYTAHLRARLERGYGRRSVYFIYATTGGNSAIAEGDWAELYQLESLAVSCAVVARRDFTRQLHQCDEQCDDRTIAHLTQHYHPCAAC